MENYWTSNKPINGLRHFVLVNETKEKGNISFLMVSVLDSEINLTKQDSLNYMDKRKLLLDEIRNEYKKISRKNSEGNIKKK
jgi:tryptophan-rich hypothetical protein